MPPFAAPTASSLEDEQFYSNVQRDTSLVKSKKHLFPSPTGVLKNFYHLSTNKLNTNFGYKCQFEERGSRHNMIHICNLTLDGPVQATFEGFGASKKMAESAATLKAVDLLFKGKYFDEKGRPSELDIIKKSHTGSIDEALFNSPIPITLSEAGILSVEKLVKEFKIKVAPVFQSSPTESKSEDREIFFNTQLSSYNDGNNGGDFVINMMTGRRVQSGDLQTNPDRNVDLIYKLIEIRKTKDYSLPIYKLRNEILEAVNKNSVTMIEGGTGCGKSTQVPQIILNQWIDELRGSECNIIVAQPKRIATYSVAQKVASERNEIIGDSVGYKMRLEEKMLEQSGGMMFVTCGTFREMRRLNPLFKGVTHIIIDEVHERSVDTDLLLLLVKKVLNQSSALKVILMSATSRTEDLKEYFDTDSSISVQSGTVFPTQIFYMDEVYRVLEMCREERKEDLIKGKSEEEEKKEEEDLLLNKNPSVNYNLLLTLIRYIHCNKPEGAVLVFLPGWQDITTLQNDLDTDEDLVVYPLHSKLPSGSQNQIFADVEKGKRKIILATNIAETSVTISDVVYVIDPGLQNDARYDPQMNIRIFLASWITKANAIQRQGRAGRVQPGEVYRLYDEEMYEQMEDYPQPEMLKLPLQTIVLKCKSFCEDTSIHELLSDLLNPPHPMAISKTIELLSHLQLIKCEEGGVNERLTPLGRALASFSTTLFFSKPLIFAALLGCVDQVLNIACLENRFMNLLTISMTNGEVRQMKEKFNCQSDLLAMAGFMAKVFRGLELDESPTNVSFNADQDQQSENEVCQLNQITNGTYSPNEDEGYYYSLTCPQRLKNFRKIKDLLKDQVKTCLQKMGQAGLNISSKNQVCDEFVLASFLSAAENITRRVPSKCGKYFGLLMENSSRVEFNKDCIMRSRNFVEKKLDYFFSVDLYHSQVRNIVIAKDLSSISPLSIALFYGEDLEIISSGEEDDSIVSSVVNLGIKNRKISFQMDERTSECIISLRKLWTNIVEYAIERSSLSFTDFAYENFRVLIEFCYKYRSLLLQLLIEQKHVNV